MDCEHALSVLMGAPDVDVADLPDYRAALEHCRTCPECAALAVGLARIAKVPGPAAPAGLADQVIGAVADARSGDEAQRAESRDAGEDAGGLDTALETLGPVRVRRPDWIHWAALASASAAVLLGAFFFARVGLNIAGTPGARVADDAIPPPSVATPEAATTMTFGDAYEQPANVVPAEVPGFIVYDRKVWRILEGSTPDRSTLATVGTIDTDLGSGRVARAKVLASSATPESIAVASGDGTVVAFSLVKRLFQGRHYVLTSDRPIRAFGGWPELPSWIPPPIGADGSPTFRQAGTDPLGITVFPLAGSDPGEGFAIAPGTPPTDPAAGNPGWTWWAPQD